MPFFDLFIFTPCDVRLSRNGTRRPASFAVSDACVLLSRAQLDHLIPRPFGELDHRPDSTHRPLETMAEERLVRSLKSWRRARMTTGLALLAAGVVVPVGMADAVPTPTRTATQTATPTVVATAGAGSPGASATPSAAATAVTPTPSATTTPTTSPSSDAAPTAKAGATSLGPADARTERLWAALSAKAAICGRVNKPAALHRLDEPGRILHRNVHRSGEGPV